MTQQPETNRQHGLPIGDGMRDTDRRVATGDRREEVHFEPDPDQGVRAEHLKKPAGPLPPQTETTDGLGDQPDVPVQDVAVAPEGPSVWDARPVEDDDVTPHPGNS